MTTSNRDTLLLAIADRAYALANDGESAPDYRWLDQYIRQAAERYGVEPTVEERRQIEAQVRIRP